MIHLDKFARDLAFIGYGVDCMCDGTFRTKGDRLKIIIDEYLSFKEGPQLFKIDIEPSYLFFRNRGDVIETSEGEYYEWWNETGRFEELYAAGLDDIAWNTASKVIK